MSCLLQTSSDRRHVGRSRPGFQTASAARAVPLLLSWTWRRGPWACCWDHRSQHAAARMWWDLSACFLALFRSLSRGQARRDEGSSWEAAAGEQAPGQTDVLMGPAAAGTTTPSRDRGARPCSQQRVEHDALPKPLCANGMCRCFSSPLLQRPARASVPPPSAPSMALAGATGGRSARGGVVADLQWPCSSSPRYCLGRSSLHPASMHGPGAELAPGESPGGPLVWLHPTRQAVRVLLNRLKVFSRSCPRIQSVWKGLGTPGLQPQGGLGGAAVQGEGLRQDLGRRHQGKQGEKEGKGGRERRW